MDSVQGYSSEDSSDNEKTYTNTRPLKSLNVFKSSTVEKNRIDLAQPLRVDLGTEETEEIKNDTSGNEEDYKVEHKPEVESEQDGAETGPKMREFNMRQFYEENSMNKDKYKDQLESNQPLKQLAPGTSRLHQLSSLIKLGQANKAKLQEMHKGSKVHKPKINKNQK